MACLRKLNAGSPKFLAKLRGDLDALEAQNLEVQPEVWLGSSDALHTSTFTQASFPPRYNSQQNPASSLRSLMSNAEIL